MTKNVEKKVVRRPRDQKKLLNAKKELEIKIFLSKKFFGSTFLSK